jgi:hypothetical protein
MNHQDWNPVVIHGAKHSVSRPARPHREVTKEQKLDQTELGTHYGEGYSKWAHC